MNNLIIKIKKSILKINQLFFILIIIIDCFFFFSNVLYQHKALFFFINIIMFILFYILNKEYINEFSDWKEHMKTLNGSVLWWRNYEIKNILLKKLSFKENEDTYKLFKNMYVSKNLIAKDYEDLKNVFIKFIPELFLKEIGHMWTDKISLGLSVKKQLNVMFLDIIWFTSMTEKLSPDKSLSLLNTYFEGIVDVIKRNWWYVDKFLWDGIMIVFDGEESDLAIKSAIEIQNFIKKFQISEIWKKISIWIWINSWEVILWTIWSSERMEITIIWDIVNTASRIEWLTRAFRNNILISDKTYNLIKDKSKFTIENLWFNQLKWKKKKIKLYWVKPIINIDIK